MGRSSILHEEFVIGMVSASISNSFTDGAPILAALEDSTYERHPTGACLPATETAFISNAVGAGLDWEIVTVNSQTKRR